MATREPGKPNRPRASGCVRCREALPELAGLSSARARAREPHLAECESCRNDLAQYQELFASLGRMPVAAPSRDLTPGVLARIQSSPPPAWASRPRRTARVAQPVAKRGWFESLFPRILVPAAGLAAVLLLVWWYPRSPGDVAFVPVGPGAPVVAPLQLSAVDGTVEIWREGSWQPAAAGERIRAGAKVRTGVLSRAAVQLPDGSWVKLQSQATATVARNVVDLIDGRGRFEIVHDPSRTFTVTYPGGSVRVLGTTFEVEVRPGSSSRVDLIEGRVEVEYGGRHERIVTGESLVMVDGQIQKAGGLPVMPLVSDSDDPAEPAVEASPSQGPWDAPRIESQPAGPKGPVGLDTAER